MIYIIYFSLDIDYINKYSLLIAIDLMLSNILINYIKESNFIKEDSLKDPNKLILLTIIFSIILKC